MKKKKEKKAVDRASGGQAGKNGRKDWREGKRLSHNKTSKLN